MGPLDTSSAANELQIAIFRQMSHSERLKLAIESSDLARKLTFARLKQEHPEMDPPELVRMFLRCILDEDKYPASLK
jgi:hypothetical protein